MKKQYLEFIIHYAFWKLKIFWKMAAILNKNSLNLELFSCFKLSLKFIENNKH